ncbi:MAG TPA: PaaI family thioesterase [Actinomycetota bacterium]|nr:PaaI family thioesterase [Actinomycetota bacterium]
MSNSSYEPRLEGTVFETLGIEVVESSADKVVLRMEVGPPVHQPFGLLHGGVSAVLVESAASIGTHMTLDPASQVAAGIELNISHLRGRRDGFVIATGVPVRKGRTLHVWAVDIADENGDPVAVGRCTVAVRSRPS